MEKNQNLEININQLESPEGGVTKKKRNVFYRAYRFYLDGIRSMTLGRTLWAIVIIKLFIMFGILRVFFFPRHMGHLDTQEQKAEYVIEQFTNQNK